VDLKNTRAEPESKPPHKLKRAHPLRRHYNHGKLRDFSVAAAEAVSPSRPCPASKKFRLRGERAYLRRNARLKAEYYSRSPTSWFSPTTPASKSWPRRSAWRPLRALRRGRELHAQNTTQRSPPTSNNLYLLDRMRDALNGLPATIACWLSPATVPSCFARRAASKAKSYPPRAEMAASATTHSSGFLNSAARWPKLPSKTSTSSAIAGAFRALLPQLKTLLP